MNILIGEIDGVEYYAPEHRTSPPFITEPTSKAGIPTIVYECYSYESEDIPKENNEPVYKIVSKSFKDEVINNDKDVLIKFYVEAIRLENNFIKEITNEKLYKTSITNI